MIKVESLQARIGLVRQVTFIWQQVIYVVDGDLLREEALAIEGYGSKSWDLPNST